MRLINLQNHTGWPGNMQKSEKKNSNFFFQGHPGHPALILSVGSTDPGSR